MATMAPEQRTIAFVLYPGLTPLDLVGPLQVFASLAKLRPEFRPVVVAERIAPMATDIELDMMAEATFADLPEPEIIVVPGGIAGTLRALSNDPVRQYVRSAGQTADTVVSVCTGSLILASVGLLEGRPATTHWGARGVLENLGSPYQRKRWVRAGNVVTTAGVSAGIDMALWLVAELTDEETARRVQLDIEYDPQPPFGGLDLSAIGRVPRAVRSVVTLVAPLMTRRPKRMSRQAGWA